jgi:hypothetical protein
MGGEFAVFHRDAEADGGGDVSAAQQQPSGDGAHQAGGGKWQARRLVTAVARFSVAKAGPMGRASPSAGALGGAAWSLWRVPPISLAVCRKGTTKTSSQASHKARTVSQRQYSRKSRFFTPASPKGAVPGKNSTGAGVNPVNLVWAGRAAAAAFGGPSPR